MKRASNLLLVSFLAVGSFACSSSSFEVASGETNDGSIAEDVSLPPDTAAPDTTAPTDTATPLDAGPGPDTSTVADSGKKDTAVVDTGCALGATMPCECGGQRTCGSSGAFGECLGKCSTAPARFLCFFGMNGCTNTACLDSNNCPAKCGCSGKSPGDRCGTLADACWNQVCEGYICP